MAIRQFVAVLILILSSVNAYAVDCVIGGGVADPNITSYVSVEAFGNNAAGRADAETVDDLYKAATGQPADGLYDPWLGTTTSAITNNEAALFTTNGVAVDVALLDMLDAPNNLCEGTVSPIGAPALSNSDSSMQGSAPKPAGFRNIGGGTADGTHWTETPGDGDNGTQNGLRFTFASPVKEFGVWLGDVESSSVDRTLGYMRLLDAAGARIGVDVPITPTNVLVGGVSSVVDQTQCGNTAANLYCGNNTTRFVGFTDSSALARVKTVIYIVGDDDFGDTGGSEHISFIGADTAKDFGDAPATFGDASHYLLATPSIYIGTEPDAETATPYSVQATGDDGIGIDPGQPGDDEDGVPREDDPGNEYFRPNLFPLITESSTSYTVPIEAVNGSGGDVNMRGWIDFDHDGVFSADEASDLIVVPNGANTGTPTNLVWSAIPADIDIGTTYIRIRITSGTLNDDDMEGLLVDGEVEDHTLAIAYEVPANTTNVEPRVLPEACQVVVLEELFDELVIDTWGAESIGPTPTVVTDWTPAGGGEDTYANVTSNFGIASANPNNSAIYFGNGEIRRVSPDLVSSPLTFNANGQLTSTLTAVELRSDVDDLSGSGVYGGGSPGADWGPEPVTLTRSIATVAGTEYQINFSVKSEGNSATLAGVSRIDVPGGTVHFEIPETPGDIVHYTVFFTASAASSDITFVNYGHFANQFCKTTTNVFCTLDGYGSSLTTELILDDVFVYEKNCDSFADLGITKDDGIASAAVGETLTYSLTVTNNGPDDSGTGTNVVDVLPTGITVNSGAAGAVVDGSTDWACNSDAMSPQNITCSWSGAATGMVGTSTNSITITTDPIPASAANTTLTNSVTVNPDPDVTDSVSANDNDTHDTPVTPVADLSISKDDGVANAAVGDTLTYTVTVANAGPNASGTGVTLSDTMPANITVPVGALTLGGANAADWSCTGGAGGTTLSCTTTASIASGSNSVISFVTNPIPAAATSATQTNTIEVIEDPAVTDPTPTTADNSGSHTTPLDNVLAPTLTKTFAPDNIANGGVSTMTLVLTNPNGIPLTITSFADTYPAGSIINATPDNEASTCVGTTITSSDGGGSISIAGGSIPANGSCNVTVDVTSTVAGTHTNTTDVIDTAEAPDSGTATDDLVVAPIAPILAKSFSPTSIAPGGTSTLTLTITNPNAIALSNLNLLDTYSTGGGVIANATPANAATTCTGGNVTAVNGAGSVALADGTLAAGGSCTVTVIVTSSTAGVQTNLTGVVSSDEAPDSNTATADLTVSNILAPTLTKTFAPDNIANGGVSTMTLVLTNPNGIPLTITSFADTYPAGSIINATPDNEASTCVGTTITSSDGGGSISIAGGSIPANGSCNVTVDVTSTVAGTHTNTTDVIDTAEAPDSGTATDDLVVNLLSNPQIGLSKVLSAAPTLNADGTFNATFDMVVENTGDVTLNTLTLVDDMAAQFGSAFVAYVTPPTIALVNTSGNSVIPTAGTLPNIFAGTDGTLAVGDQITITGLVVTLDGNAAGAPNPFLNVATVGGTPPGGGTPVADDSNDGTDPTAGAGGPVDPTPVVPPTTNPEIGIAKVVNGEPVSNGDGTFNVTFDLIVENTGDVPLSSLTLVDDMAAQFGSAFVGYVGTPTIALVNTSGNSTAPTAGTLPSIFAGTDGTLAVGDQITITGLVVTLDANATGAPDPLLNVATVGGTPPGSSTPVTDESNDGTDPTDGPGGPVDPTPVELPALAALTGTVWLDASGDDIIDPQETLLDGWTVNVLDASGNVILDANGNPATAVTDANGFYSIPDLPPGNYTVEFVSPNGVTFAQEGVTLPVNVTVDVPLPIDPSGVVYDAVTRQPVAGATLTFIDDSTGLAVPAACLLPGQQNQVTDADGNYRFDLVLDAPAGSNPGCPTGGTFSIAVVPPTGYTFESAIIPVETGALDADMCTIDAVPGTICEVQAQDTAPQTGDNTIYFLSFTLNPGSQDVINNHIPLDPPPANIVLSKSANKDEVLIGDLVQYTLEATNDSGLVGISNAQVVDNLPAGFAYVDNTAVAIQAGLDGVFGTGDDVTSTLGLMGTSRDPITLVSLNFAPSETILIRYLVSVGTGVSTDGGEYINVAQITDAFGNELSNIATAAVRVTADPMLEETTIIGKVWHDRDSDGYQDNADATGISVGSDYFGWNSLAVGDLPGRIRETDPVSEHQTVVRMPYNPNGDNSFRVSTKEGTVINVDNSGTISTDHSGLMARGMTAQDIRVDVAKGSGKPTVSGNQVVAPAAAGTQVLNITITNHGLHEEGIPGVRLATVEGLLIETDQFGRYHVAGVDTGHFSHGTNYIIKVDDATLPEGSVFTTENPRVQRLTTALMTRFNFGVDLPDMSVPVVAACEQQYEMVSEGGSRVEPRSLGGLIDPVRFESGKSQIPANYAAQLESLINSHSDKQNLRVRFIGHTDNERLSPATAAKYGTNQGLSEARAKMVADVVMQGLSIDRSAILTDGYADTQPVASNSTRAGMAQNRRVEIELVYDEVIDDSRQVRVPVGPACDQAPQQVASETVTDYVTQSLGNVVEPVRFASGKSQIPAGYADQLRDVMAGLSDKQNLRLRFTGHTDNERLAPSTQAKYGSNQGLSEARAKMVADNMASQLGLSGNQVAIAGFGDTQPIASNSTRDGMAQNRRVEVEVLYDEAITRTINAAPAPMAPVAKSATLPHGGVIWATEDPGQIDPRLDIMASGPLVVDGSNKIAPIEFSVYSNYQAYIETYKISLYHENDTDLVRPVSELVGKTPRFDQPVSWDGYLQNEGRPEAGEHLVYVLEVTNATGHTDRTAPQLLRVIDAEIVVHEDDSHADRTYGGNSLVKQNIPIHGSRVRLHGKDIDRNYTLMINDQQVQIGEDNNFVYEQHLPMGEHSFAVNVSNADGQTWDRSVDVSVDSDYLFVVAMANLTLGENDTSGDLSPLNGDHHFDGSEWVDGRIAAYMKGKVGGKYLVTAQIDTTEDDIDNLGDNLSRKDGSSVFRRLDADQYYATYGDDSTTVSDVDTQGAFYLRVDWDNNKALWGNYNTQITGNEFAQYNRSLYGAQFVHESLKTNDHGDNQSAVYAFASEAQTASAHNEYLATGGSLYYLRETDIVRGSEKVWVEVRSRDSQRVVDLIPMEEGRDYQIDYLQGRIILNRPLSQVANQSASIIRDQALEGDDVILAVDYEYQPQGFTGDDVSAGIRGKGWLGNAIGVGATYVTEDRDNAADYTLSGVDVTLKAGKGTWLKAEYAESESTLGVGWQSRNGGLSFAPTLALPGNANNSGSGEAFSIEGQINLADLTDSDLNARINVWYKDRDAGFSSTRIGEPLDSEDIGFEASYENDVFGLTARANQLTRTVPTGAAFETITANLQGQVGVSDHWSVIGELRYEDSNNANANLGFTGNGDALLGALGLKYRVNDHTDIWGSLQSVLEDSGNYSDNDAFILGVRSQMSEHLAMMAEVSSGDRGDALNLGIDWSVNDNLNLQIEGGFGDVARSQVGSTFTTAGGLELYGSYAVDTDRTDNEQQRLTFGQAQRYGDGSRLYAEQQFTNDKVVSGITHIFGVDHRLTEQMGISASLQSSSLENAAGDIERTAGSIGADYQDGNRLKASARLEYREDTGAENTTQWLTTNALDWQQNDHLRWVVRLNLSMTENDSTGLDDGKFIEGDIGFAYRPASNDRLNILGKYTYLYDLPASLSTGFFTGQNDSSTDQKMHVFSLEALYDLTRKWELGAKIASRQSQTRAMRGSGAWYDSGATLAAIRARYHMVHNWDALAEYHILSSEAGDDERHGALLALYRHVGSNFKIGIGYNFTDFSDDLTNTSYDANGFFIDLTGKY